MRKRLAVVSILVLSIFGVAAASASACGGPVSCPPNSGLHPLGLNCNGFFL